MHRGLRYLLLGLALTPAIACSSTPTAGSPAPEAAHAAHTERAEGDYIALDPAAQRIRINIAGEGSENSVSGTVWISPNAPLAVRQRLVKRLVQAIACQAPRECQGQGDELVCLKKVMAAVSRHYKLDVAVVPTTTGEVSLAWLGDRLSLTRHADGRLYIR
jgi:hypothetical protein